MSTPFEEPSAFDKLVHEPARLTILTALSVCRYCDFKFLQSLTHITNGNLSGHLQKLENAQLVEIEKGYRGRVPRTKIRITPAGRTAIQSHWRRLEDLRSTLDHLDASLSAPEDV